MTTHETYPTACLPPWHYQRSEDGSLNWFRPLSLFGNSKIHYRVGSVPDNEHTRRIWDFGSGSPWTCDSCGNVISCPRSDEKPPPPPSAFDGYPYLVTRIGHSALRSVVILPAEWTRGHLIDLARRQATANRLDTCLCIGPDHAIYITPDGKTSRRDAVPTGIPVGDRLALSEPIPDTPDVLARRASLEDFRQALVPSGYLVGDGLEGGRVATGADLSEVKVRRGVPATTPHGLIRCTTCRGLAGEFLATKGEGNGDYAPRVIQIHCRCDNDNRCARCGSTLADYRLSSYYYDEVQDKPMYVAAYMAFSHQCPDLVRSPDPKRAPSRRGPRPAVQSQ